MHGILFNNDQGCMMTAFGDTVCRPNLLNEKKRSMCPEPCTMQAPSVKTNKPPAKKNK